MVGLDPVLTVIAAAAGNLITIAAFAYGGAKIRAWVIKRREEKGSSQNLTAGLRPKSL